MCIRDRAGSKDSIFPELATMIFLDILFEPQEFCKIEIKIINIDKKTFFFIFHNYLIFLKNYLSKKFVKLFDLFLKQMFF